MIRGLESVNQPGSGITCHSLERLPVAHTCDSSSMYSWNRHKKEDVNYERFQDMKGITFPWADPRVNLVLKPNLGSAGDW